MSENINENTSTADTQSIQEKAALTNAAEASVSELPSEQATEESKDTKENDKIRYDLPPAIEFENVTKRYFLYGTERSRFKAMFTNNKGVKEHPALDDVSFKIYPGESVGFIGRNGAGKSTILKLITGVSYPTKGDITVRGKVAALLELTAGFSAEMTGRENIALKGLLLGLTEDDVAEIEDDIVEFADLGEYIDQPVRTYSSGMKMRLGFAININIRPDILVVDEALSVGDARFKRKCRKAINNLIAQGVTVLFVSHSADALKSTCNRAIYLKNGTVCVDGTVEEALEKYNADIEEIKRIRREKKEARKRKRQKRLEAKRKREEKERLEREAAASIESEQASDANSNEV